MARGAISVRAVVFFFFRAPLCQHGVPRGLILIFHTFFRGARGSYLYCGACSLPALVFCEVLFLFENASVSKADHQHFVAGLASKILWVRIMCTLCDFLPGGSSCGGGHRDSFFVKCLVWGGFAHPGLV